MSYILLATFFFFFCQNILTAKKKKQQEKIKHLSFYVSTTAFNFNEIEIFNFIHKGLFFFHLILILIQCYIFMYWKSSE